MKRIIILMLSVVFLVACGGNNFNSNIDKEYAKDTENTLNAIQSMIDKVDNFNDLDSDDKDLNTLYDYIDKWQSQIYEGDEEEVYQRMHNTIDNISKYYEKENLFTKDKQSVENILYK